MSHSESNPKTDHAESPLQAAFFRHKDALAPDAYTLGEDDHAVYKTLLESTKAIP